ncbi:MAG: ACT domain-containing protein [Planctomycetota bacterium]|jgi:hypothetical protein
MEIAEQLSIFLENKPGVLASVSSALAEAGVNLRALCVSDTVDHAVVRLVPSDHGLARDVLERGGALVVETEVLVLTLPDKPGALADVARKFADAEVNIEYSYGSGGTAEAGILVMRVSDMERAKKALA